jgi:hypothetical protein
MTNAMETVYDRGAPIDNSERVFRTRLHTACATDTGKQIDAGVKSCRFIQPDFLALVSGSFRFFPVAYGFNPKGNAEHKNEKNKNAEGVDRFHQKLQLNSL